MLENYIIPLPVVKQIDFDDILGIDLDQVAADVAHILVPFKCEVVRAQLIITETCGGTTTPGVVKFDKRPTAGDAAARGDGDIAEFNMAATAAGNVLYDEVASGTILNAGDEVVVEITTAPVDAAAGHFEPVLLVKPMSESLANLADMVETA